MEIKIENVENLIGFFYGGALLIALIAPKSVYSPLYLLIMTLIYIFLYLERRMTYFEGPDIKPVYRKNMKKWIWKLFIPSCFVMRCVCFFSVWNIIIITEFTTLFLLITEMALFVILVIIMLFDYSKIRKEDKNVWKI